MQNWGGSHSLMFMIQPLNLFSAGISDIHIRRLWTACHASVVLLFPVGLTSELSCHAFSARHISINPQGKAEPSCHQGVPNRTEMLTSSDNAIRLKAMLGFQLAFSQPIVKVSSCECRWAVYLLSPCSPEVTLSRSPRGTLWRCTQIPDINLKILPIFNTCWFIHPSIQLLLFVLLIWCFWIWL